ncbi:SubName: Full=Uncharacterized protein {ECO:0000313/EMBL:CCA67366.1} [Serendipita indica DSM 11827]|uniref:Uncharacterized protein n=1 Tax=Serendipita indica (strain DSM 11827) TaxID=1109443 RepID=G4T7S9_SERID|nr:SubName: Full=Uncharacterized protein {ECO:0000313/EMBL:CCA67366.1} [Serendipita indica DSM 11827]CCA67366.1 hypothetical protein PIIN_01197 [Serendipita indica DSM 11827]
MSSQNNSSDNQQQEPTFSILPHPAKTNNPADLQQGESAYAGSGAAALGKGPHVLDDGVKSNLEQPLSREELRKRAEELNK